MCDGPAHSHWIIMGSKGNSAQHMKISLNFKLVIVSLPLSLLWVEIWFGFRLSMAAVVAMTNAPKSCH